jgi:hypothetical protein
MHQQHPKTVIYLTTRVILSIQKIGDLIKTNGDLRTLVIWQTDMVI